jgi:hypothetical protein
MATADAIGALLPGPRLQLSRRFAVALSRSPLGTASSRGGRRTLSLRCQHCAAYQLANGHRARGTTTCIASGGRRSARGLLTVAARTLSGVASRPATV